MNRIQFIIVTTLAGAVALCIFLQIILVRVTAADADRLRQSEQQIQEAQVCFNTWKEIVSTVAQVAEKQNDQALKDLLTRQGLTIKNAPASGTTTNPAPAPAAPAPSTH